MGFNKTTANLGLVLPDTNDPDDQAGGTIALLTAALVQIDTLMGLQTDTGTANTYGVTLSPAIALYTGMELSFTAVHSCTGASTFALNGGSAKAIKKQGTTALASGDILATGVYTIIYDGTNWQLINPVVT